MVREALSLAIDRGALVEYVTRGGEKPAHHFVVAGTEGHLAPPQLPENPARAKQLLAQAGFPDGSGFPLIELLYNTAESHQAIAEAIQEMWRKNLGIKTRLVNQEWQSYLAARNRLQFDVSRAGWVGAYNDSTAFLKLFAADSENNFTGWHNADYDRLITAAEGDRDLRRRSETLRQAEAILLQEMPVIPLYFYTRNYLIQPSVKGWEQNLLDIHPYKNVRLEP